MERDTRRREEKGEAPARKREDEFESFCVSVRKREILVLLLG